MSANLACRRQAFDEVGGFSPLYPRCEDREREMRLWRAGKRGLDLPIAEVLVDVPPSRLTKDYHRRGDYIVAHYHALTRDHDTLDASDRMIPDGIVGRGSVCRASCTVMPEARGGRVRTRSRDAPTSALTRNCYRYDVSFFRTRWATAWGADPRRSKTCLTSQRRRRRPSRSVTSPVGAAADRPRPTPEARALGFPDIDWSRRRSCDVRPRYHADLLRYWR